MRQRFSMRVRNLERALSTLHRGSNDKPGGASSSTKQFWFLVLSMGHQLCQKWKLANSLARETSPTIEQLMGNLASMHFSVK